MILDNMFLCLLNLMSIYPRGSKLILLDFNVLLMLQLVDLCVIKNIVNN